MALIWSIELPLRMYDGYNTQHATLLFYETCPNIRRHTFPSMKFRKWFCCWSLLRVNLKHVTKYLLHHHPTSGLLLLLDFVCYHRNPRASFRSISRSCSCRVIFRKTSERANSPELSAALFSIILDSLLLLSQVDFEHLLWILGIFSILNFNILAAPSASAASEFLDMTLVPCSTF